MTIVDSTFSSNTVASGGRGGAIFNSGTLTITDSTFTANTTQFGGAIFSTGTLTITGSTFDSNIATAYSGAIYNNGGTATIIDSDFINNRANASGGVIYNVNGAVLTITDSRFNGNRSLDSNGGGGAIYNTATLTVNNSVFENNSATLYGGAIFNHSSGTATITDSEFTTGNRANSGGAIYNTATLTITGSTFSTNTATGSGGAVYNRGTLTVSDSTFTANTAATGSGGAIHSDGTLTVLDSTFTANTAATGSGGAIASLLPSNVMTVLNSTFSGNTAGAGGAISNLASTLTIMNSTFSGNTAASSSGGAISNGGTLTVLNSTFSGNIAADNGGAIYNNNGTLQILNSILIGNTAANGSDIWSSKDFAMSYSIYGAIGGAGIITAASNVGNITGITAADVFGANVLADNGGKTWTLAVSETSVARSAGAIIGRTANGTWVYRDVNGTNVWIDALGNTYADDEVDGMILTDQRGEGRNPMAVTIGAYQYGKGGAADPTDTGDIAVAWTGSDDIFDVNNVFYGTVNQGINTGNNLGEGPVADGGTLYLFGINIAAEAEVLINKNVTIQGTTSGLALYAGQITNSILNGNFNNTGSRIFAIGNVNSNINVYIDAVTFQNGGSASSVFNKYGGAIFNNGILTISNSTFSQNTAAFEGGAIASYGRSLTVSNSTFMNNSTTARGGAIANEGNVLTVSNSTFYANTAGSGGAIYNNGGILTILNSTFFGNTASSNGGAINTNGTVTILNSIIVGNTAANGADIYTSNAAGFTMYFSIYGTATGTITGSNNLSGKTVTETFGYANPVLADNGGNTLTIMVQTGSLAATSGVMLGKDTVTGAYVYYNASAGEWRTFAGATVTNPVDAITTDQRGENRNPFMATMGAYEANAFTYVAWTGSSDEYDYANNTYYTTINDAFYGSDAIADGATLYLIGDVIGGQYNVNVNIDINVTIVGKTGTVLDGGGTDRIFNIGSVNSNISVTINGITFRNGYNSTSGGAIYNKANLTITNSTFSNNNATIGFGGAIYNSYATLTVENSTFSGNSVQGHGGAISSLGTLTVTNSTFYGNTAEGNGGAIVSVDGTVTIIDSTFLGNSASYGGALYTDGVVLQILNSILVGNTAAYDGMDIFATDNYTMHFSIYGEATGGGVATGINNLSGKTVTETFGYANPVLADNGGNTLTIMVEAGSLAATSGGMVGKDTVTGEYVYFNATAKEWQTFAGVAVTNPVDAINTDQRGAHRNPYAVTMGAYEANSYVAWTGSSDEYDYANNTYYTTINDAFYGSNAIADGATLYLIGDVISGPYNVNVNIDINVTIVGKAGTVLDGGGTDRIFNIGTVNSNISVTINNITFRNGYSSTSGGAIYNSATLTINDSVFQNNTATAGGGAIWTNGTLTVTNSTFSENTTNGYGGAIYSAGTATITNSTFTDNSAVGGGGAVANFGTLTITNSTFDQNTAGQGGAIYSSGTLTITNSTFYQNTAATSDGGAIANYGRLAVLNSTFVQNTAANNGGAIFNISSNFQILNSIIVGNTATNGADIFSTAAFTMHFSIYGTATGTINGSNNLDGKTVAETFGYANPVLADNGGSTQTIKVEAGGLAAGSGVVIGKDTVTGNYVYFNATAKEWQTFDGTAVTNPVDAIGTDQRGMQRDPYAATMGAYEANTYVAWTGSSDQYDFANNTYYATIDSAFYGSNAIVDGATLYLIGDVISGPYNVNVNIDINVTIIGQAGTILDGGGTASFFAIGTVNSNITVTIDMITFRNGYNSGNGGAIYNEATLVITNSVFTNNSASSGGAIYNVGSLTISDSTFTNNSASTDGGAIWSSGVLTVTDSTFSGNSATTANVSGGGAIAVVAGTADISNSTFDNNTAYYGGAIATAGDVSISNSTFYQNTGVFGGAFYNVGTSVISNSTFYQNTTTSRGGAIYNNGAIDVSNSTFYQNTTAVGGAIYNNSGALHILNSIIIGNTATTSGSDIYSSNDFAMSYSIYGDIDGGGAITTASNVGNLTGITASDVFGTNVLADNGGKTWTVAVSETSAARSAGAIIGKTSTGVLVYRDYNGTNVWTDVDGNTYTDDQINSMTLVDQRGEGRNVQAVTIGAYQYGKGGTVGPDPGDVAVAWKGDADIFAVGNTFYSYVNDGINGANAVEDGGILYLYGISIAAEAEVIISKNVTIQGTTLGSTTVSTGSYLNGNFEDTGSRIFTIVAGFAVNIDAVTFQNGMGSGANGGAIYNSGTLTITNSTFMNNSASSNGGAIYNAGTLTVTDSTFSNNTAVFGGGAIYNSATLTINNSTFSSNNTTAMSGYGGAIYNLGTLDISNSTFSENTAEFGGAIHNNGAVLTISNSTFMNNSAGGNGGAIYSFGMLDISNSTFYQNSAANSGGAIDNSGTLDISNSTFYQNSAANSGGAISNYGALQILNSIVIGNTAAVEGSDIYSGDFAMSYSIYGDIFGTIIAASDVGNLMGITAADVFGTNVLADNGGKTWTVAVAETSPARSAGAIVGKTTGGVLVYRDYNGTNVWTDVLGNTYTDDQVTGITLDDQRGEGRNVQAVTVGAYQYGKGGTVGPDPGDTAVAWKGSDDIFAVGNTFYAYVNDGVNGVNAVEDGGTLYLYGINIAAEAEVVISKNVTIQGTTQGVANSTGSSLNGDFNGTGSRIFTINAGYTVNIDSVTFQNGMGSGANGGAIYNEGTLTVTNSTFTNNNAVFGGAVYNTGTLTLMNSTFTNNSALDGGAVYNTGTLTVTSSTFMNNSADISGGAIYTYIDGVTEISNSTFTQNTAGLGGAIYTYIDGFVEISNSTFYSNTAEFGGAIVNGGTLNVSNTTFYQNTAGLGGAIYNSSTLQILNSIVIGNTATIGSDIYSALDDFAMSYSIYGDINGTILAASDVGNLTGITAADVFGTNVLADNGGKTWTVAVAETSPARSAGAIIGKVGTTLVYRDYNGTNVWTDADGNTYTDDQIDSMTLVDQRGEGRNVQAVTVGAYQYGKGGTVGPDPGDVAVAWKGDADIFAVGNTFYSYVNDGVNGVNSVEDGGILYLYGINIVAEAEVVISKNITIQGTTQGVAGSAGSILNGDFNGTGSRIFTIDAGYTVNIDAVTFQNGKGSGADGGAIYNSGTLVISNSTFMNNSAEGSGGAIYSEGSVTITSSMFTDNSASANGGAIASDGGVLSIANATFTNNSASANGGAIYMGMGELAITESEFAGNSAVNGGAIYITDAAAEAVISSAYFINNEAQAGGAIYNNSADFQLSTSTFNENKATSGNGGALYNGEDGGIVVVNTFFAENEASGDGGAIYSKGTAAIVDSTVTANTAANGGGIYLDGSPADGFTLLNNIFVTNTASVDGNDIYNNATSLNMAYNLVGSMGGTVLTNLYDNMNTMGVDGSIFTDASRGIISNTGIAAYHGTLVGKANGTWYVRHNIATGLTTDGWYTFDANGDLISGNMPFSISAPNYGLTNGSLIIDGINTAGTSTTRVINNLAYNVGMWVLDPNNDPLVVTIDTDPVPVDSRFQFNPFDDDVTLREAVAYANIHGGTVTFVPSVTNIDLNPGNNPINVYGSDVGINGGTGTGVTINGTGAANNMFNVTGDLTLTGNLDFNNGIIAGTGNLSISSGLGNSNATANMTGGNAIYNGGNQSILGGNYNNLYISGTTDSTGPLNKSLNGDINVSGDFGIQGTNNTNYINFNGNGNMMTLSDYGTAENPLASVNWTVFGNTNFANTTYLNHNNDSSGGNSNLQIVLNVIGLSATAIYEGDPLSYSVVTFIEFEHFGRILTMSDLTLTFKDGDNIYPTLGDSNVTRYTLTALPNGFILHVGDFYFGATTVTVLPVPPAGTSDWMNADLYPYWGNKNYSVLAEIFDADDARRDEHRREEALAFKPQPMELWRTKIDLSAPFEEVSKAMRHISLFDLDGEIMDVISDLAKVVDLPEKLSNFKSPFEMSLDALLND